MSSCGGKFYLSLVLILGLWLDVCEQCSAVAVPAVFLLVKPMQPSAGAIRAKAERKSFDELLKREHKCTLDFFQEFERLTKGNTGNYNIAQETDNFHLKEKLFAECKATFVDDFTTRVAALGVNERRLVKLDHVRKSTDRYSILFQKFDWIEGGGQLVYACISVMGDGGAFASGAQLTEEDFNDKYVELVEKPCASLRQNLEPAAGIFRMYSGAGVRERMLNGVDETFDALAAASSICDVLSHRNHRNDYEAYTLLLEDQQLPGDPNSGARKAKFDRLLGDVQAATGEEAKVDKCNVEFFSKLDTVIEEAAKNGRQQEERESLERSRAVALFECKDQFEHELEASIRTLEPALAASMTQLGGAFYRGQRLGTKLNVEAVGDDILSFMKQADPLVRDLKLDAHQFAPVYSRLVVEPCRSLNLHLEPAVNVLRKSVYVTRHMVNENLTKKLLWDWIERSDMCQKSAAYLPFVQERYKLLLKNRFVVRPQTIANRIPEKKPSRFGRLFGRKKSF